MYFQITPSTLRSADCWHIGMHFAEPHSLVSRDGISPHFIDGSAFCVKHQPYDDSIFQSHDRYIYLS